MGVQLPKTFHGVNLMVSAGQQGYVGSNNIYVEVVQFPGRKTWLTVSAIGTVQQTALAEGEAVVATVRPS
jgi:hypothetical protein